MTYTKGPWKAQAHTGVWEVVRGKTLIAELNVTHNEVENARLIAAAPDLLETLEQVHKALELVGLGGNDHAYHRRIEKLVVEAIKKARG